MSKPFDHPGPAVRALCLAPNALSVGAAAQALGVTRQALNNLVNGHAAVTADMAVRLEKAFGIPASDWLERQMRFDLARAEARVGPLPIARVSRPEPAQETLL